MKKLLSMLVGASLPFCVMAQATDGAKGYTLNVKTPADMEGAMAYIVNFDTGAKVDSVLVEGETTVFKGQLSEPFVARLIVDGKPVVQFILEEGDITLDTSNGAVTGGNLNQKNEEIFRRIQQFYEENEKATTPEQQRDIVNRYLEYSNSQLAENRDNPIGYMLFVDRMYDYEPAEFETFLEANPYFKKYARVQKQIASLQRKAATSEGSMFTDFEIEYEGVKHKLSDVVGKGDYVLVDFWASWCGPCIRQTAVLKDIYNEYAADGLKILGVAVWDEPENTKKAIVQHELPWESWLNGQNVPTDAYGISGIPCIILFGPDGTILSRDKQSNELKAAVAKAMQQAKEAKK